MRRPSPIFAILLVCGALVATVASADRPSKRQSDKVRGKMLYERHCIQCHGPTGAGNGPATDDLVVDIPDLRGQIDKDNREAMVDVVLSGRGAMPGYFMTIDRHDARRAVRHLQRIAPADAPDWPAPDEPEPKDDEADDTEEPVDSELPDEDGAPDDEAGGGE